MIHKKLYDYHKEINILIRYHSFSIEDIENLIPFERDLQVGIIIRDLAEKKEKAEREQAGRF